MSTPALLRLREAHLDAHIALLTHEKLADLWTAHPAIDSVLTFAEHNTVLSVARMLRTQEFQIGLALPNSPRSALELWLARVPERIGLATRWRGPLLTTALPPRAEAVSMHKRSVTEIHRLIQSKPTAIDQPLPGSAHHIFHYLYLATALGAKAEPSPPQLIIRDAEIADVRKKFELSEDSSWWGLNPGAEYGPAKRWPVDRFIASALEVQRRVQGRWLLVGGRGDVVLTTEIASALQAKLPSANPVNLAGKTTLRELCAVLKLCRVLLTNDTGPMHAAAAVGTPVVALFGSTSPELTAPGLPGDRRHRLLKSGVPCSPCFLRECPIDFRCMHGISVETVVQSMVEVCQMGKQ